eukprot:2205630-Pyramimonas_sp.AAC.1
MPAMASANKFIVLSSMSAVFWWRSFVSDMVASRGGADGGDARRGETITHANLGYPKREKIRWPSGGPGRGGWGGGEEEGLAAPSGTGVSGPRLHHRPCPIERRALGCPSGREGGKLRGRQGGVA